MKFRNERYIQQIEKENGWTFRVRYRNVSKYFNECDYLSSSQAFKEAVNFRNKLLIEPMIKVGKSVQQIFNEIDDIYVLRSETKRKIKIFFNKYINNKNTPIEKITRADIISDLNKMVDNCSNDTIQRVYSIWKKIFGVAIAKNYVLADLTINIKCPLSHKSKAKERYELIDEQSLELLANRLKTSLKSPLQQKQAPFILWLLYYTGMRPAEVFALDKKDLDFKNKTISISKEVGSDRDNQNVIRNCKTDCSHRTIPMSNKVYKLLKEAVKLNDSDILFPNDLNEHYSSKDVGDRWHRIAKSIGIDFHLYQCRHTFITNLFMQNVDLKTIQNIVGQKIDATTISYVVSNEEKMKNAMDLI